MRLQRMIALTSELSRRSAEEAILKGEVSVNGAIVTELGTSVDITKDRVELLGRELKIRNEFTYLAYFKPKLVVVTKKDPEGRRTIWEDLGDLKNQLNSVGRLDYDSEGLLILTDDGDLINRLTHPKHEIWKSYVVRVKGVPTDEDLARLRNGVKLSDGPTLPAKVKVKSQNDSTMLIELEIREGRNRQIRRMCDEIGYPVISLRRICVGPVKLGTLEPGRWKKLKPDEIAALKGK